MSAWKSAASGPLGSWSRSTIRSRGSPRCAGGATRASSRRPRSCRGRGPCCWTATLAEAIRGWPAPSGLAQRSRRVDVPVSFDGEDLPFVAAHWGLTVNEAVARLTGTAFTVAFCGFAPGFAYLRGLAGSVPRLDQPRTKVPAGSVALAGAFAGIYPTGSPGGWRLVGRTTLSLFDVDRDPPALLTPGTTVRLVHA
jgi:KipI family sensor histidine kinase inhibitor